MEIKIMKNILDANQNKAEEIKKLLSQNKILMINLIGAPGAGKTTLLEKTILSLEKRFRMAVIEGYCHRYRCPAFATLGDPDCAN